MSIKLGIISDIHANLPAFQEVLCMLDSCDKILIAGDLVGYGPRPNEVIEMVKSKKFEVIAGNHDTASVTRNVSNFNDYAAQALLWTADHLTMENLEYLNELPRRKRFQFEGVNILMVHGSPEDDDEYICEDDITEGYLKKADCEVLIVGHSHIQWTVKIGDKLALNPGSVGQPRDRIPDASYAFLTLPEKKVEQKRVKYDIDLTARMIVKARLPRILADRLYIGY